MSCVLGVTYLNDIHDKLKDLVVFKVNTLSCVLGVSYLNDMQDKLKDLVFHLHLNNGKTDKMASLDLTEAKEDL